MALAVEGRREKAVKVEGGIIRKPPRRRNTEEDMVVKAERKPKSSNMN